MEVNMGTNIGGGMGVGRETAGEGVGGARRVAEDGAAAARPVSNLTIGRRAADLSPAEPTAEIPAAALVRNDPLGNLVNSAFSLPPPPMPAFAE